MEKPPLELTPEQWRFIRMALVDRAIHFAQFANKEPSDKYRAILAKIEASTDCF